MQPAEDGPWGYIDSTVRMVIQPRFNSGYDFSEGIARITSQDTSTFGLVDKTGKVIWEDR